MENEGEQARLIERAFPLKQASLDSVHEKNVRHGHISTLHIWPARRPLAACRAALIATLLPDPGDPEERRRLIERIGGRVVPKIEKKKVNGKAVEVEREETVGGVLHWGRESSPDLQFFREEIRKAYGGRAPRVLDPFAGGGAIPLEAMRLGCEVTAIDINPVAWFILKCTLEYPQKLAGQKRPLPDFVLRDREFMESFFKAQGLRGATLRTQLERLALAGDEAVVGAVREPPAAGTQTTFVLDAATGGSRTAPTEADLAWHVRAWGWWVLQRAKADLERFYPTIDGKPTVAYLWARTVKCKNCRAIIPLLKTKWLCKKDNKRVLLRVEPNADRTAPVFSMVSGKEAAAEGGNGAQRREYDKKLGAGTMSRSGVTCVCCGLPSMTREDLRLEGEAGRFGMISTVIVVETPNDKEYRLPTADEIRCASSAQQEIERVFAEIPFGVPDESVPRGASRTSGGTSFPITLYGFNTWRKLFTPRQLLALGVFLKHTRSAGRSMGAYGYSDGWLEAQAAYLAISLDRAVNYMSTVCIWEPVAAEVKQTFLRFALPITWDFAEANPLSSADRYYNGALSNVGRVLDEALRVPPAGVFEPRVIQENASLSCGTGYDAIVTDPPYYDAINYADLMDFF